MVIVDVEMLMGIAGNVVSGAVGGAAATFLVLLTQWMMKRWPARSRLQLRLFGSLQDCRLRLANVGNRSISFQEFSVTSANGEAVQAFDGPIMTELDEEEIQEIVVYLDVDKHPPYTIGFLRGTKRISTELGFNVTRILKI